MAKNRMQNNIKIKIKKAKDLEKKNEGKELKKKSENKMFKSHV